MVRIPFKSEVNRMVENVQIASSGKLVQLVDIFPGEAQTSKR